jgi:hypothetical protein
MASFQHTYTHASTAGTAGLYKAEYLTRAFVTQSQSAQPAPASGSSLDVIPAGHNVIGVGFGTKVTVGAAVHGQIAVTLFSRPVLWTAATPRTHLPG